MAALKQAGWGKGIKEQFVNWFHNQLQQTIGDRQRLEDIWTSR